MGDETPAPLIPGRRYRVSIQLNDAGSVFPAGHRIRVALSTTYWPMIWPIAEKSQRSRCSAEPLTCRCEQPVATDALLRPLPEPETARTRADHGGPSRRRKD